MPELITIKKVAEKTQVSQCAVRQNVVQLLEVLEVEERVEVMEYMLYCKELRHRRIEQDEGDGEEEME